MYVSMYLCTYVLMYVCMYVCMYAYTCIFIHRHTASQLSGRSSLFWSQVFSLLRAGTRKKKKKKKRFSRHHGPYRARLPDAAMVGKPPPLPADPYIPYLKMLLSKSIPVASCCGFWSQSLQISSMQTLWALFPKYLVSGFHVI